MPYTWHSPSGKRQLEVAGTSGARSRAGLDGISLDKVSNGSQPLRVGSSTLWMQVSLRGDTRILSISEVENHAWKRVGEGSTTPKLILLTALQGIGISLVRSSVRELAYLRISHLELNVKSSSELIKSKLRVGDFRVDNQATNAKLPTVLSRLRIARERSDALGNAGTDSAGITASSMTASLGSSSSPIRGRHPSSEPKPFMLISLSLQPSSPEGGAGHVIPSAALFLDEIEVQVEEAFLLSLQQFSRQLRFVSGEHGSKGSSTSSVGSTTLSTRSDRHGLTRANAQQRHKSDPAQDTAAACQPASVAVVGMPPNASLNHVAPVATRIELEDGQRPLGSVPVPLPVPLPVPSTKWYFQEVRIDELRVNLTYKQGEHLVSDLMKGNPVFMQSLERMSISLNRVYLADRFEAPSRIGKQIVLSYKRELLLQVYKILFHIDLLGNPLALTRDLVAGVKDFFTMPLEGLTAADPEMFMRGLGKGTFALAKGVVGAGLKLPAQVSSSFGRNLAIFSFDSKYVREREIANAAHRQARHLGDGLISGSWALARGVGDGLTGFITAPLEGAKKQGMRGMFKGFGQGIAGAIVKPIAGSFDFVARTMEGGANTFDYLNDMLIEAQDDVDGVHGNDGPDVDSRMRPPRMMHGPERATRPYSRSEAIAQRVLSNLKEGVYCTEGLILSVQLTAAEILVLTEGRLLRASTNLYKTTMHVPLSIVHQVSLRADGKVIQLWLKHGSRKPMRKGDGTISGAFNRGVAAACVAARGVKAETAQGEPRQPFPGRLGRLLRGRVVAAGVVPQRVESMTPAAVSTPAVSSRAVTSPALLQSSALPHSSGVSHRRSVEIAAKAGGKRFSSGRPTVSTSRSGPLTSRHNSSSRVSADARQWSLLPAAAGVGASESDGPVVEIPCADVNKSRTIIAALCTALASFSGAPTTAAAPLLIKEATSSRSRGMNGSNIDGREEPPGACDAHVPEQEVSSIRSFLPGGECSEVLNRSEALGEPVSGPRRHSKVGDLPAFELSRRGSESLEAHGTLATPRPAESGGMDPTPTKPARKRFFSADSFFFRIRPVAQASASSSLAADRAAQVSSGRLSSTSQ